MAKQKCRTKENNSGKASEEVFTDGSIHIDSSQATTAQLRLCILMVLDYRKAV
ncbi:hypothetical protein NOF04DRAFT_1313136 [Fusarium oxysporum II5]|nr:hypothetical protein NOF04DRAFT_1313136 [Fusarium oxysporum II5]